MMARLAFLDGVLSLALIILGALGAHFQIVGPFVGFQMFAVGFLLAILGSIVGIIAMLRTRTPERRASHGRAVTGTVLCLIAAVPILILVIRGRKYPPINDITTDVDNPPEFVVALTLPDNQGRDMKYDKAKYAEAQKAGYGIIAPLKEPLDVKEAWARVQEAGKQPPTWNITRVDNDTMTLEAVSTSKLFRFPDDVIIQVRPTDGGSLIEMRSKSRFGIGDFGVNRRRIQRFFDRLALARDKTDTEPVP